MSIIKLKRGDRIKMFLHEYYFGQKGIMTLMRLLMGPFLIIFCHNIYIEADTKFEIGYGLFGMLFGIYYILIPYTWILFRWSIFRNIIFEINFTTDNINLKDEFSVSNIDYSAFKKILKRKTYYILYLNNLSKIYLPNNQLNTQEIELLNSKIY